MDDNKASESHEDVFHTPNMKRKRKPKLTHEEKAERSKELKEERENRRNANKRAKRSYQSSSSGVRTYGTGISDGERKPYSHKHLSGVNSSTTNFEPQKDAVVPTPIDTVLPVEQIETSFAHLAALFSSVTSDCIPEEQPTEVPSTEVSSTKVPSTEVNCQSNSTSTASPLQRNKDPSEAWTLKQEDIFYSLIDFYTVNKFICDNCCSTCENGIVKCSNCCKCYCPECDRKSHCYDPTHIRSFFRSDFTSKILLPTETIDSQGIIKEQSMNYHYLKLQFIIIIHA